MVARLELYAEGSYIFLPVRDCTPKQKKKKSESPKKNFDLTPKAKAEPPTNFYGIDWQSYEGLRNKMGAIKSTKAHFLRFKLYPNPELISKPKPPEESAEKWAEELAKNPPVTSTLNKAIEEGFGVIPYIGDGAWPKRDTTARENYLIYAKKIVQEYGPASPSGITEWEIWNEPNMQQDGGAEYEGEVSPKEFGTFFKEMADAVNAGAGGSSGSLTVLTPGLFGYRVKPEECHKRKCPRTPREFLDTMDTAPGAKESYDAISLHPYVFRVGGEGHTHAPSSKLDIEELRERVRQDMVDVGTGKPIYVTEIGFPVEDTASTVFPPVGPAVQKKLLKATFAMMQNQHRGLRLHDVLYYNIQDTSRAKQGESLWEHRCGLFPRGESSAARPAWSEFKYFAEIAG